jgi:hypothetical protein
MMKSMITSGVLALGTLGAAALATPAAAASGRLLQAR